MGGDAVEGVARGRRRRSRCWRAPRARRRGGGRSPWRGRGYYARRSMQAHPLPCGRERHAGWRRCGARRRRWSVWTIVVAGGSGRRFGAPKQFAPLAGRRVVDVACDTAARAGDGVVVVLPPDAIGEWSTGAATAVAGGSTRSESVRAGLAAVPDHATVICVHDAARPLATTALFRRVIAAVGAGADGAVPAVPVADTIKIVGADDVVCSTPDRATLVAVQTPQAFRADVLRTAHASGDEGTDDASLVERRGGRVVTVEGEAANRKITTPADLEWAHAGLGRRRVACPVGRRPRGQRVRRASLRGRCVPAPGARRLRVPGPARPRRSQRRRRRGPRRRRRPAGSGRARRSRRAVPRHRPPNGPAPTRSGCCAQVVERVRAEGWRVGNADCSVVCEAPKLAPRARRDAAPPGRRARRSGQREGAPARGPRGARARRGRAVSGLGGAHASDRRDVS